MKAYLFLTCCGLALMLASCTEQAVPTAKKEEKIEPVSGQTALFRMYQVARSWSPDVRILNLHSIHLTEVPTVRGEAGAWQAVFTSSDKSAQRSYTYSVVESEGNLHQGVFPGQQESWSGPAEASFLINAVKIDTEAAYKTALKEAGDYDKKNPKETISFELTKPKDSVDPEWRVMWGESAGTAGLSVFVDATTGKYLKTLH